MRHLVRRYFLLGLSSLAMLLPLPWLHAATLDNNTNFPEAVNIKLTPGAAGTGTLTVTTPNGLSAVAEVTVA